MFRPFLNQILFEIRDGRHAYFFRRPLLIGLTVYVSFLIVLKKTGILDRVSANDPAHWAEQRCAVTGIISSHPDPRLTGVVTVIDVETIETLEPRSAHSSNGQLLLQIIKSTTPFANAGDRVRFYGRIQAPKTTSIPGTFDYQDYLANQGVRTVVYTSSRACTNLGDSSEHPLVRLGWNVKRKIVAAFDRALNAEQSAVLSGLAVGNRPRFYPEIKRIFVESGTMHVLVASGSNVAFVIALCFFLFRLVRVPRRWALPLSLPFVWLYALVAGADAPILRAGVMGTVGVISYALKREERPLHALALSAWVILLVAPRDLFNVGFQMSFLSVFGLLHFLPWTEEKMRGGSPWLVWPLRLWLTSVTAQLWLLPVMAATFHRIFLGGLLSNLLLVPLAAAGLPLGVGVFVAEKLPHALQAVFLPVARMYLNLLIGLARMFADHASFPVWLDSLPAATTIGLYFLCLSVVGFARSAVCKLGCLIGALLLLFGSAVHWKEKPRIISFTLTWVDTGKRLATVIQTPSGDNALLLPPLKDPKDTMERIVSPFLATRGVSVSTTVVCDQPCFIVKNRGTRILIAPSLTTKIQRYLLETRTKPFDVIQTHFPRNWIWRPEFLERFKPKLAVETNAVSAYRPSIVPWPDVEVVTPQKTGWDTRSIN